MSNADPFGFDEVDNVPAPKPQKPALDLSAFPEPEPKAVDRAAASAARQAAAEAGFSERAVATKPQKPPTPEVPPSTDSADTKPKRKTISRRPRGSAKDNTGVLSMTGDAEILQQFIRRAVYMRATYTGLMGELLQTYDKIHGPVPDDFEVTK